MSVIRYGQIREYDVANGEGIRVTLFTVGCYFNCFGCFNKEYQNFEAGELWTDKQEDEVLKYLDDNNVSGFSLLGGEIFHLEDLQHLIKLLKRIKKEQPTKDIWIWSGFTFDELIKHEDKMELISLVDVLVDGLFKQELKDLTLKFRGSTNQRIIDVQESLQQNRVILYDC